MAEREIPDDIDRIATDLVRTDYSGDDEPEFKMYLAIAEALLSERRQCADIAYDAALYSGCPADFIAEEIAETVRNGERRQPMRPSR